MKRHALALACALAALSSPVGAAQGQAFEALLIGGSATATSDTLFKINVATGQTWWHAGENSNLVYTAISDAVAPPAGDYHFLSWSNLDASGHSTWALYRFDGRTGHTWVLAGGGGAPFTWTDLNIVK